MRTTRALSAVLIAVLLGGCVYYNGMYNTKRLAGSARRAERDGRTFEATNLWGQVVTRAESLVARHPDSKYVDEALVLKGIALARLNQCEAAVGPLGRVSLLPPKAEVTEEAALALGRCQLRLGAPGVAEIMFARAAESKDPVRRREALLLRGRALRTTGRHQEAVAALEGSSDPRASDERLLALAGAGQREAALALADSMLATRDTATPWDTMVVAVGREDPATASALVDRLRAPARYSRDGSSPALPGGRSPHGLGGLGAGGGAAPPGRRGGQRRRRRRAGQAADHSHGAHANQVRCRPSRARDRAEPADPTQGRARERGGPAPRIRRQHPRRQRLGRRRRRPGRSPPLPRRGDRPRLARGTPRSRPRSSGRS